MRTLLGLLLITAIVGGFAFLTVGLPRWRTGEERVPLVRGVVVPTEAQLAEGPLAYVVELWPGRPGAREGVAPLDDDAPSPSDVTESLPSFAFELSAGEGEGGRLVVLGVVETAAFERFCGEAALPSVRLVDGEWVARGTGRPPPRVRIEPTEPC